MISRATNGYGHEHRRQDNARYGEDDRKAALRDRWSEESLTPEDQHEDHACDHRRYGKRQVDQGQQELLAAKLKLSDRPTGADAEHDIQRHRDRRRKQGEPECGEGVRLQDGGRVGLDAAGQPLDKDGGERNQEEETQECDHDRDQDAPYEGWFGDAACAGLPCTGRRYQQHDSIVQPASRRLVQPCKRVDGQEQHEGNRQHHHRDCRRARVVVLLELGDDEQRGNLRTHRHVARDEDDRSVFAHATRKRQRKSGEPRRNQIGKDDPQDDLTPFGAEAGRRLFELDVEVLDDGLERSHDERQSDEHQGHGDAERRERYLDSVGIERFAQPAVGCIQRREGDAGNCGRQGERQIDQRVDIRRPGKL